ncbi:hypothetical protein C8R46DRAFT_1062500 [Mycena filopes]|nr:hypothetical protein C8R46DRAFT_1062500 [Mycena filopes]
MSAPTDTPESSPDPVFVPAYPFAPSPAADTILRSCDGADFHVIRAVLSLVSPVFETMFGLPQPDGAAGIPVVDMSESSTTLDRGLRFFYSGAEGPAAARTLEELGEVLELLVSKYDIQSVVPQAKRELKTYLAPRRVEVSWPKFGIAGVRTPPPKYYMTPSQPLGVYAIVFAHRWDDIGLLAARECLKLPLRASDTHAPRELAYLTSTGYHNLFRYHFRCAAAVRPILQDLSWLALGPLAQASCWFRCDSSSCQPHPETVTLGTLPRHSYRPRAWFMQFLKAAGDLVAVTPAIDLSQDPAFFAAVRQASDCGGKCRREAVSELRAFVTGPLARKIEQEIAKIEWKF